MKTTNPSSRITLSQKGNQILSAKYTKSQLYIIYVQRRNIRIISGLDYMGNIPMVPD